MIVHKSEKSIVGHSKFNWTEWELAISKKNNIHQNNSTTYKTQRHLPMSGRYEDTIQIIVRQAVAKF